MKLSLHYVAGLYDGDGSFMIVLDKHPTVLSGYQIQTAVVLGLATYDSTVFSDIVETFPDLKFTTFVGRKGTSFLRLRDKEDVYKFLGIIKPYLRVFSNVRRAEIMYEVVKFILEHKHGMHYKSDVHFDYLRDLIAKMRMYSKRSVHMKRNLEVVKDVDWLRDEGQKYVPESFDTEYVAGLFDSEGYVGLINRKHPKALLGFQVYPIVNINLAIYDSSVLLKLKEMFSRFNPQLKFREQNNTALFQIVGNSNVKQFLATLCPYLKLPTMKKRVEIILEAIDFMERGSHKTENGKLKLLEYVNELKPLAKRKVY